MPKLFHSNVAVCCRDWENWRDQIIKRPLRSKCMVEGLSIVTWNTPSGRCLIKPLGQFELSAKQFGYDVDVLVSPKPWTNNREKIRLIVDYLATVTTPYVLAADSADVLIIDALDTIIADFETYGCDLLFSANLAAFIRVGLMHLHEWQMALFPSVPGGTPRFLDAGMWIGRTGYCRDFFQKALLVANEMTECPRSEQACILVVYREEHPRTQIDRHRKIFQTPPWIGPLEAAPNMAS